MQYTIRDMPLAVDSELRRRAKVEGKSLNAVAIEALLSATGLGEMPHDLILCARDRHFDHLPQIPQSP